MSRKATGLKRPIVVNIGLTADEDELLSRESEETKTSKAELLRQGFFKNGSAKRLIELREKQKGLPVSMFRRDHAVA